MLLKQIVIVGVCVFALMLVVKDGRVLRMAGLTGSCSAVRTYPDSTSLVACRGGKLNGAPDLSGHACTSAELTATFEYWHCAAGVDIRFVSR